MDLVDGMKAFVATVDAQSFTRAGQRLGMSNKLVSKYVAQLEAHLQVRLLHRTTRKLGLTSEGRKYYRGCIEVLSGLEELESSLKSRTAAVSGTLRIAVPSNFGETFLMHHLVAFQRTHPDISLDVSLSDRYVDLASEGFDLAIRLGDFEDGFIITRKLGELENWIVASPDFLQDAPRLTHPTMLADIACLRDSNLSEDHIWHFSNDMERFGVQVGGKLRVNSAVAVRQLALMGEGVAMTPHIFVEDDVRTGRLVRLFEAFELRRVDIRVAYLNATNLPARHRAFIDFLVATTQNDNLFSFARRGLTAAP